MTGRLGTIDVNHDVFRDVRRTMADVRPDAWLVGEHCHDATVDLGRRRLARCDGVHVVHAPGLELAHGPVAEVAAACSASRAASPTSAAPSSSTRSGT